MKKKNPAFLPFIVSFNVVDRLQDKLVPVITLLYEL